MIDADEIIYRTWNDSRQMCKELQENKNITPVPDNYIKFEGVTYELEQIDIQLLTDLRYLKGYDRYYDGPEKEPGDAEAINGLYLSSVGHIAKMIKFGNEGKLSGGIRYKIVNKKGE